MSIVVMTPLFGVEWFRRHLGSVSGVLGMLDIRRWSVWLSVSWLCLGIERLLSSRASCRQP